jgi:hypothetical protein
MDAYDPTALRPLISRGPVELAGSPLTQWADYAVDGSAEIATAYNAPVAYEQTAHRYAKWTAKVNYEVPIIGRNLPPVLSIGTWAGVLFTEYTLTFTVSVEEGTGGDDDWARYAAKVYGWKVEATRWQASDSFGVFLGLLIAQSASTWASVAFTSPFGTGNVLVNKAAFSGGSKPSQETLGCTGQGAFTNATTAPSPDPLVTALLAQMAGAITNSYTTPTSFEVPEGSGYGIFKTVEFKVPSHDKVTKSFDLEGDGPFGPGIVTS